MFQTLLYLLMVILIGNKTTNVNLVNTLVLYSTVSRIKTSKPSQPLSEHSPSNVNVNKHVEFNQFTATFNKPSPDNSQNQSCNLNTVNCNFITSRSTVTL